MRTSRRRPAASCRATVLACALVATVSAQQAHAQASERPTERSGHLIALSDPPGAYVYVDGLLLGQTPLRSVALSPGEYRIWFRSKPPLTFEPEPLPERIFRVVAGDSILVHETMGALVRVESSPTNAMVTVGGRAEGRTPIEFRYRPRDEEVRVSLDGHRSRRIDETELLTGGTIRLRLLPLAPAGARALEPSAKGGRPRTVNWKAWGSLAAGAAAAGLAIHFKAEADDAYDRYRASAIPGDMERFLDDSNRFDRLSSISWIAAEGGFLAALWFFARDVFAIDRMPTPIVRSADGTTSVGLEVGY